MFNLSNISRLRHWIANRIAERVINTVLPARCIATGQLIQEPGRLHSNAWGKLSFIQDPICATCGTPFDYGRDGQLCLDCLEFGDQGALDRARSVVVYDDASRGMILRFKHADDIHSADLFAGWLARLMEDLDKPSTSNHDPDLILPVPLHLFRHIKRGYNQSSLLAHHLSGQTGIKTSDTILRRVKPTPSQGGLSPVERANNVNDAFAIADGKASELKDRHIILVDDVRTTGATLESCAGVLKQAGASEITGLTIARVI